MDEPSSPVRRLHLKMWGLSQDPPLFTMKAIAAKLEVRADELSDLFGQKPRRSYAKLRKTIEKAVIKQWAR